MSIRTTSRRRLVAGGLLATTLAVGGAGVAAAAVPGAPGAGVLDAFGLRVGHEHGHGAPAPVRHGQPTPAEAPVEAPVVDESAAYNAFWNAGYSYDDAIALADLWQLDVSQTKVKAGHLVIDGQALPIPPSGTPTDPATAGCEARTDSALVELTEAQYDAFWGAGYTVEDMDALAKLWDTGCIETKARAGQLLLDGQPVPVAPGSSIAG